MREHIDVAATIGPTLQERTMPLGAVHSIDIARLNFSHVTVEDATQFVTAMRSFAPRLKIWQDLQGPKIRVGNMVRGELKLEKGQKVCWYSESQSNFTPPVPNMPAIPVALPAPFAAFQTVQTFSMKDGTSQFTVSDNRAASDGYFIAIPTDGVIIRKNKSINAPAIQHAALHVLTEKDLKDMQWGIANKVDIICLSFVNDDQVVKQCRSILNRHRLGTKVRLWAKIETRSGYIHFESIIEAADGIVLGRGDLVPEIGLSEASLVQYDLLARYRNNPAYAEKDFIVATHVLESMRYGTIPTITEINDITNSVRAGATGFMLGGEVSSGRYPGEAIEAINRHLDFMRQAEKKAEGSTI